MLSTRGENSTCSAATSRYIGSSAAMHSSIVRRRSISSLLRTSNPLVHNFEQPRCTHAAADAHGDDDVLRAAPAAFDQRVADKAGARHAVGMADRDGAAIHVEPVVRDAEAVAAIDHLHGEGFVQLPK